MRSETISIHGGFRLRSDDQGGRRADLSKRRLRVRERRSWRGAVQSRSRRLPLLAHRQSDHRHSGAARRRARRRRRRAQHRFRPGGAALCDRHARRPRRQHRHRAATLWHDPHAVRPYAAPAGHRGALCGERPRRRDRAVDRREHARGVLREHRQSGGQYLRHRSAGESRAPAWRAARRRQYGGDADPAAPDRPRRRYRGAFADQIHGRPRRRDGRRDRRRRRVRLERPCRGAFRCSTSPTNPITAWSIPSISARRPMSRAAAASISARPARCLRR